MNDDRSGKKRCLDSIFCILFGCLLARIGYQTYNSDRPGFGLMVIMIGVVVMAIGMYLWKAKKN